uniref:methyltransferase-like protein 7A n=1 Tax=Halichoerus grypus TaxID=9711 RepID=UPI001659911B|nr:methyltransferase-like protein 7A [Halichoerus grypus]
MGVSAGSYITHRGATTLHPAPILHPQGSALSSLHTGNLHPPLVHPFPMFLLNFLGLWNQICKKWFPYFMLRCSVMYNQQMASKKRELFSNLQDFVGPSGKLSLLEIGCGTGANFKFYPPGCSMTCSDPSPNFEKFLIKSVAENRHLQFERFVVAAGENMPQVADGSMDVVVCTLVLCSVESQERILQEVRRVLRPVSEGL